MIFIGAAILKPEIIWFCQYYIDSFIIGSLDLLIDWKKGEQYFMKNLIDGDFASNNRD